jgi:hypothetical protein
MSEFSKVEYLPIAYALIGAAYKLPHTLIHPSSETAPNFVRVLEQFYHEGNYYAAETTVCKCYTAREFGGDVWTPMMSTTSKCRDVLFVDSGMNLSSVFHHSASLEIPQLTSSISQDHNMARADKLVTQAATVSVS